MDELINGEYAALLGDIKARIHSAQYAALKAVNKELIALYWGVGQSIVERQQAAGWGSAVVEKLSADIRAESPGIQGFSTPNLWRMKQFYATYADNVKLSPLVREIGWSHNIVILRSRACSKTCRTDNALRAGNPAGQV